MTLGNLQEKVIFLIIRASEVLRDASLEVARAMLLHNREANTELVTKKLNEGMATKI